MTLEVFSGRFYKYLDDNIGVSSMLERDKIVCFELPCHARQSRSYKAQPDDPFIVPVSMTVAPVTRSSYYRSSPEVIGYPFVAVIERKSATSVDGIYACIVDRLSRWTTGDLYKWEEGLSDAEPIDGIPIQITGVPPPEPALTEITESGEVVTHDEIPLQEEDISDQKHIVEQDEIDDVDMEEVAIPLRPVKIGPKPELFTLTVQPDRKEFGSQSTYSNYHRAETWANREKEATEAEPWLLQEDDFLVCEFDENIKQFYFGDSNGNEGAQWATWVNLEHPEYLAGKEASATRQKKTLHLDDCLDAFTAREELGEDGASRLT